MHADFVYKLNQPFLDIISPWEDEIKVQVASDVTS